MLAIQWHACRHLPLIRACPSLPTSQKRLEQLRAECIETLNTLPRTVQELKSSINLLSQENMQIENKLELYRREMRNAEAEKQSAQIVNDQLLPRAEAMGSEVERVTKEAKEASGRAGELRSRIAKLENTYSERVAEKQKAEAESAELERKLQAWASHEAQVEQATRTRDQWKAYVEAGRAAAEKAEADVAKLREQCLAYKAEMEAREEKKVRVAL